MVTDDSKGDCQTIFYQSGAFDPVDSPFHPGLSQHHIMNDQYMLATTFFQFLFQQLEQSTCVVFIL